MRETFREKLKTIRFVNYDGTDPLLENRVADNGSGYDARAGSLTVIRCREFLRALEYHLFGQSMDHKRPELRKSRAYAK